MKFVLLVLFIVTSVLYFPLNRRKPKYYWSIPLDKFIPIIPIFIIPYASFLIYVPLSLILLWTSSVINSLLTSLLMATTAASIFWTLFPNGVHRPPLPTNDLFSRLINWTYRHDHDTNAFPSSHVFSTLICSHFLLQTYSQLSIPIIALTILIISSTLFTKQHYAIDVLGGFLLALTSIHIPR